MVRECGNMYHMLYSIQSFFLHMALLATLLTMKQS